MGMRLNRSLDDLRRYGGAFQLTLTQLGVPVMTNELRKR